MYDSISWVKYYAEKGSKKVKKDTANFYFLVDNYLDRHNIRNKDSILNNKDLFNKYLNNIFRYEYESDIQNYSKNPINVYPYDYILFAGEMRYSELYDRFYYLWKNSKDDRTRYYYSIMADYQCPEIIDYLLNLAQKKNKTKEELRTLAGNSSDFLISYNIKIFACLLTSQELISEWSDISNEIPVNVRLFTVVYFSSYSTLYGWGYDSYSVNCDKKIYEISYLVNDSLDRKNISDMKKVSDMIIENRKVILNFLKSEYKNAVESERYWKENLPFYRKETDEEIDAFFDGLAN